MNSLNLKMIVAIDDDYGIGKNGKIPWKSDLSYFKKITTAVREQTKTNCIIMGRKTYESMNKCKYIRKSRMCCVLSKSQYECDDYTFSDLKSCLQWVSQNDSIESIFIVGGSYVYKEAFRYNLSEIYITKVNGSYDCDTNVIWLKNYLTNYCTMTHCVESEAFSHQIFKMSDEMQYIQLLKDILENGELRSNRTDIKTLSVFGKQIRFDISKKLPLLTSKRVYWKGVMKELLWFIKGDTSATRLNGEGIKIWNGNSTREFLDNRGLEYSEGDVGPVYGFQWRHWNADYDTCDSSYDGKGIDQLSRLIESIKSDPYGRRHILSAWNVGQLDKMALPPCHIMCQFYVSSKGLSCQMYQRSVDTFLGLPFNIASYAVLTYIIAHVTGYKPYELVMCLGDTHIYENHIDAVKQQISNPMHPFPTLKINKKTTNIDDLEYDDFELMDYNHSGTIKAEMAV